MLRSILSAGLSDTGRRSVSAGTGTAEWLADLRGACATGEAEMIKQAMKRIVPEYQPYAE